MRCLQAVIVRSTVNFEPIQLFACWLFPTTLRATAGTRGAADDSTLLLMLR
jgi:hypothetical protein